MKDAAAFAQKYTEDLMSFFGLNVPVETVIENDIIKLSVPANDISGSLIGTKADTLIAFQNIINSALRSQGHDVRANLDIAGYKRDRQAKLAEKAKHWVERAVEKGEDLELNPMNSADRRVVHQVASDMGIQTESIGEGRERRVLLKP
ncbi:MAG: R3H domain-containing nucleic acid-binding protein [Patescibacteria group bacterium]